MLTQRSCVVAAVIAHRWRRPRQTAGAQDCGRQPLLADSGAVRDATGISPTANPPARVERDEERPLEGRDSRPRLLVADRLGRSASS